MITVAGMLVIAKGVVKTGVIARATWRLLATVTTAAQAMRRLIVPVGVASALMNTTPLVAMLVPATRQLQQTRDIPAREVLLPIAHATTLVGSVTLIGTSSNLLIAGIASDDDVHVSMLSFAPVALPVCLVGWVLLLLAAPRMLRGEAATRSRVCGRGGWRFRSPRGRSPSGDGRRTSASSAPRSTVLQAIVRHGELVPAAETLEAGDRLVFAASEVGVSTLWESPRFGLSPQHLYAVSVGPGEHGTLLEFEDDDAPGHRRADSQAAGRHHRRTRSHGLRDLLEHRGSGPPRGLHPVGAGRRSRASTRQDLDSAASSWPRSSSRRRSVSHRSS